MTCEELGARLDAWLQGRLPRHEVAAFEAHVQTCGACRVFVDDARLLQRETRLIGLEGPPAGAWERLAERLERQKPLGGVVLRVERSTSGTSWRWIALAAMLAVVIGSSLFFLGQSLFPGPSTTPVAETPTTSTPTSLVESIELELDQAAEHYERAISGLEQVASESDSPLDPVLTATLRESLQVIDEAIADSRDALRSEPGSQLAQQSLFDAFRRKVALLQDTIALMNEMRKGNQAGAAAIASGLNKG